MKLTLEQVLEKYQSNIYKAAFYICKHHDDAEDIAQEAFLAYFKADQDFESEEHIKAWLLRVTVNKAKNLKTSFGTERRSMYRISLNGLHQEMRNRRKASAKLQRI